jgi:predicted nucleic acid-binding protein
VEDLFVIDNSVVMSWCFEDESAGYADEVLDRLMGGQALVPEIWPLEVANVLLVAERRKRITRADSGRFLTLLRGLPIEVMTGPSHLPFDEIMPLARETGLSSYDASYLALATRQGLPMATLDASLRRAAKRCKVPLLN